MIGCPPIFTLFPYTTLFRSRWAGSRPKRTSGRWQRDSVTAASSSSVQPPGRCGRFIIGRRTRSEEHTSELQSHSEIVCRLLLEKNNNCPAQVIYGLQDLGTG